MPLPPLKRPRMASRRTTRGLRSVLLDRDGRAWLPADAREVDGKLVATRLGITHRVFSAADGERRVAELLDAELRHWDAPLLQQQLDRARVVRGPREGGDA